MVDGNLDCTISSTNTRHLGIGESKVGFSTLCPAVCETALTKPFVLQRQFTAGDLKGQFRIHLVPLVSYLVVQFLSFIAAYLA